MMQIALIGVGAGAASALLFASFTTGSWLAVVLFYLAPLPIMIAGLGWSHWGAAVAAAAGTIIIGLVFSPVYFMAFLAGVCVPAWWLSYLTLLARPSGTNGTATLEWYPPGRLVAWAAALGALVVLAAMPFIGLDAESFRAKTERLQTAFHKVSEAMYERAQAAQQEPSANGASSDGETAPEEEVVDAEVVDEQK